MLRRLKQYLCGLLGHKWLVLGQVRYDGERWLNREVCVRCQKGRDV
jgi:hypothetical protein